MIAICFVKAYYVKICKSLYKQQEINNWWLHSTIPYKFPQNLKHNIKRAWGVLLNRKNLSLSMTKVICWWSLSALFNKVFLQSLKMHPTPTPPPLNFIYACILSHTCWRSPKWICIRNGSCHILWQNVVFTCINMSVE